MLKVAAYCLVIISLLTSPVIAGLNDLKASTHATSVSMKADQDNGKQNHKKIGGDHNCCTAHAHYGNFPAYSAAPSLSMTNLRPPLLAQQFPAAFGPNPLLEPPSLA
jgi:hypothetical protein